MQDPDRAGGPDISTRIDKVIPGDSDRQVVIEIGVEVADRQRLPEAVVVVTAEGVLHQVVLAHRLDAALLAIVNLDRAGVLVLLGSRIPLAVARDTYGEIVDAVAVEVAGGQRIAVPIIRFGWIEAPGGELREDRVGQAAGQSAPHDAIADDDRAAVGESAADEPVVEGQAGGEILRAVAVEIAAGERPAEAVARFRRVEEEILVLEPLRTDGRESDRRLGLDPGRGSEEQDGQGYGRSSERRLTEETRWGSHADYA